MSKRSFLNTSYCRELHRDLLLQRREYIYFVSVNILLLEMRFSFFMQQHRYMHERNGTIPLSGSAAHRRRDLSESSQQMKNIVAIAVFSPRYQRNADAGVSTFFFILTQCFIIGSRIEELPEVRIWKRDQLYLKWNLIFL